MEAARVVVWRIEAAGLAAWEVKAARVVVWRIEVAELAAWEVEAAAVAVEAWSSGGLGGISGDRGGGEKRLRFSQF